jgi:hypothetical protein
MLNGHCGKLIVVNFIIFVLSRFRELQVVLDSIKENDFPGAFEAWRK